VEEGDMVDRAGRDRQIADYEAGYQVIVDAIAGLDESGLDVRERPNEWSPREVIHHLADSEMTSAIRLRRLIAEDQPVLVGYDQEEFARKLYYNRPIEPSLLALKGARESTTQLLHQLTEEEWARAGMHTESGRYTVTEWLEYYAQHCHDHADQICRARTANGV
jgi:hypothetical protein